MKLRRTPGFSHSSSSSSSSTSTHIQEAIFSKNVHLWWDVFFCIVPLYSTNVTKISNTSLFVCFEFSALFAVPRIWPVIILVLRGCYFILPPRYMYAALIVFVIWYTHCSLFDIFLMENYITSLTQPFTLTLLRILYELGTLSLFVNVLISPSTASTIKADSISSHDDSRKKTPKKPPPREDQTVTAERDSDIDASDEELYKAAAASSSS